MKTRPSESGDGRLVAARRSAVASPRAQRVGRAGRRCWSCRCCSRRSPGAGRRRSIAVPGQNMSWPVLVTVCCETVPVPRSSVAVRSEAVRCRRSRSGWRRPTRRGLRRCRRAAPPPPGTSGKPTGPPAAADARVGHRRRRAEQVDLGRAGPRAAAAGLGTAPSARTYRADTRESPSSPPGVGEGPGRDGVSPQLAPSRLTCTSYAPIVPFEDRFWPREIRDAGHGLGAGHVEDDAMRMRGGGQTTDQTVCQIVAAGTVENVREARPSDPGRSPGCRRSRPTPSGRGEAHPVTVAGRRQRRTDASPRSPTSPVARGRPSERSQTDVAGALGSEARPVWVGASSAKMPRARGRPHASWVGLAYTS